jgi:hypothetical protein
MALKLPPPERAMREAVLRLRRAGYPPARKTGS